METPEEYIQQKHAIELMVPKETKVSKNKETSINYVSTRDIWNRNNIIIDNIFAQ